MTDAELRDRFARQLPALLPASDWDDVRARAARVRRGPRRPLVLALAAALVLLALGGAALGYHYLNGPVSPAFRLYLDRLERSGSPAGIRFDPAAARVRADVRPAAGVQSSHGDSRGRSSLRGGVRDLGVAVRRRNCAPSLRAGHRPAVAYGGTGGRVDPRVPRPRQHGNIRSDGRAVVVVVVGGREQLSGRVRAAGESAEPPFGRAVRVA